MEVGDCQVQVVIAVEISDHHRERVASGSSQVSHLRLKGAVAIAQQDSDFVVRFIHHDQVGLLISIEIPHRNGHGTVPNAVGYRGVEGTVTVAQKHAQVVGMEIRHRQIQIAVAIEISDGD